ATVSPDLTLYWRRRRMRSTLAFHGDRGAVMQQRNQLLSAIVLLLASALGCGRVNHPAAPASSAVSDQEAWSGESASSRGDLSLTLMDRSSSIEDDAPAKDADTPRLEWKVIYNATLDIVVENITD